MESDTLQVDSVKIELNCRIPSQCLLRIEELLDGVERIHSNNPLANFSFFSWNFGFCWLDFLSA